MTMLTSWLRRSCILIIQKMILDRWLEKFVTLQEQELCTALQLNAISLFLPG